jgi:excisionase family DNA binding protein
MQQGTYGKLAYSIAELPDLISLGRSQIYEEIRAGRLRTVKSGRRTLVLAEDLRSWLLSLGSRSKHAERSPHPTTEHG